MVEPQRIIRLQRKIYTANPALQSGGFPQRKHDFHQPTLNSLLQQKSVKPRQLSDLNSSHHE